MKKYLSLGAVIAGSAFIVSCDSDDVVVRENAGNTNVTPTLASNDAPTVAEITGKNLRLTGTSGTTANLDDIALGDGQNDFVIATDTSFLSAGGADAYTYNYTASGSTFTLGNILEVGAATPDAITQGQLNDLVSGETNDNSQDSDQESVADATNQIVVRTDLNANEELDDIIGFVFDNNRYKRDALVELNGTGGTYDVDAGADLRDDNGELIDEADIDGGVDADYASTNQILFTTLPGIHARLDANNAQFSGYANLDVALEEMLSRPEYGAGVRRTRLEATIAAVKVAISALEAQVALVDAEYPKLLQLARERFSTESQDGAGGNTNLPDLVIADHNLVGSVTRAFSNDNDFITEGTFSETFTTSGALLVEVSAPVVEGGVNYVAGDIRLIADNTPENQEVRGVFEIRNIGQ